MAVLTYQIRLLEPVLVTKLDGDPNSNISYDYLPGSVLRAALLGRFASDNKVAVKDVLEDERTKADAARLFFGHARFLNAYPVDRLNNRTLPKPLSWRQSKSARAILTCRGCFLLRGLSGQCRALSLAGTASDDSYPARQPGWKAQLRSRAEE
jgi:CRISPR-associated protein Csx10